MINNKSGIKFLFCLLIVIALIISASFVYSFNNNLSELKVTEEHPFLINNNWIEAKDLKVGDFLTTIDGKKAIIREIEDVSVPEGVEVYNLEDEIYHNYIASSDGLEGIIVHNSKVPSDPEPSLIPTARISRQKLPKIIKTEIRNPTPEEIVEFLKKGDVVKTITSNENVYVISYYYKEGNKLHAAILVIRQSLEAGGVQKFGAGSKFMKNFLAESQQMAKSLGYQEVDVYGISIEKDSLGRILGRLGFRFYSTPENMPYGFRETVLGNMPYVKRTYGVDEALPNLPF